MLEFAPLFAEDDFIVYLEDGTVANASRGAEKTTDAQARKCVSVNRRATSFSALGIKPGDELLFVPTGLKVSVVDDKTIDYRGERFPLSGFTKKHIPKPNASGAYQGPKYFSFKGRMLLDIRGAGKAKISASVEHWDGKTQEVKPASEQSAPITTARHVVPWRAFLSIRHSVRLHAPYTHQ